VEVLSSISTWGCPVISYHLKFKKPRARLVQIVERLRNLVLIPWQHRYRPTLLHALLALALLAGCGFFVGAKIKPLWPPFKSIIWGWDDSFYYFWLRSPLFDGDLDFSNDILYCDTMPAELKQLALNQPRSETGLILNKYPIGWALSSVPWVLAGDVATRIARFFGFPLKLDGYGPIYQFMLMLGQFIYAVGGLFFSFKILEQFFDRNTALESTLLVWLASFMFAYQTVFLTMAHNIMFFALAGTYYFTLRLKTSPGPLFPWVITGILSGFLILTRYQAAVFLVYPFAVATLLLLKKRTPVSNVFFCLMSFIIMLTPQIAAWKLLYGRYVLYTYTGEAFSWLSPHLLNVLFSPYHGLFYWHPVYLVGFLGFLVWAWRNRSLEAICWSLGLLGMIYINACWSCWWLGTSFGSRAFDGLTLCAMVGTAALFQTFSSRRFSRVLLVSILLCLVVWNLNLLVLFSLGKIPHEQPVHYAEMIRATTAFWFNLY